MRPTELAHAHIAVPADCLPLVESLITRLGGRMLGGAEPPIFPMPETERGGAMLKALRLRAGMTQSELAEAIGIPQSRISDFEKGRRHIPYKYAQALAGVLHSIPSHFMTPNAETIAAMNEAGAGGSKRFASAEELFNELGI
jgi:transcriptional regulator with XRE-family HTH domain